MKVRGAVIQCNNMEMGRVLMCCCIFFHWLNAQEEQFNQIFTFVFNICYTACTILCLLLLLKNQRESYIPLSINVVSESAYYHI